MKILGKKKGSAVSRPAVPCCRKEVRCLLGTDSSRIPVPELILVLSPPLLLACILLAAIPVVPAGGGFTSQILSTGIRDDETDSWTERSQDLGVEESWDKAWWLTCSRGAPTYPWMSSWDREGGESGEKLRKGRLEKPDLEPDEEALSLMRKRRRWQKGFCC